MESCKDRSICYIISIRITPSGNGIKLKVNRHRGILGKCVFDPDSWKEFIAETWASNLRDDIKISIKNKMLTFDDRNHALYLEGRQVKSIQVACTQKVICSSIGRTDHSNATVDSKPSVNPISNICKSGIKGAVGRRPA